MAKTETHGGRMFSGRSTVLFSSIPPNILVHIYMIYIYDIPIILVHYRRDWG
jgi:hypothetical protein